MLEKVYLFHGGEFLHRRVADEDISSSRKRNGYRKDAAVSNKMWWLSASGKTNTYDGCGHYYNTCS